MSQWVAALFEPKLIGRFQLSCNWWIDQRIILRRINNDWRVVDSIDGSYSLSKFSYEPIVPTLEAVVRLCPIAFNLLVINVFLSLFTEPSSLLTIHMLEGLLRSNHCSILVTNFLKILINIGASKYYNSTFCIDQVNENDIDVNPNNLGRPKPWWSLYCNIDNIKHLIGFVFVKESWPLTAKVIKRACFLGYLIQCWLKLLT